MIFLGLFTRTFLGVSSVFSCFFFSVFLGLLLGSRGVKILGVLGGFPCFLPKRQWKIRAESGCGRSESLRRKPLSQDTAKWGVTKRGLRDASASFRNACLFVIQFVRTFWRWHVCRVNFARKIFFELRISYEKCSEIFPEYFEPLFCGSEKIPQNSRQNSHQISLRKMKKKFTDELLQERRDNSFWRVCSQFLAERSQVCLRPSSSNSRGNPSSCWLGGGVNGHKHFVNKHFVNKHFVNKLAFPKVLIFRSFRAWVVRVTWMWLIWVTLIHIL